MHCTHHALAKEHSFEKWFFTPEYMVRIYVLFDFVFFTFTDDFVTSRSNRCIVHAHLPLLTTIYFYNFFFNWSHMWWHAKCILKTKSCYNNIIIYFAFNFVFSLHPSMRSIDLLTLPPFLLIFSFLPFLLYPLSLWVLGKYLRYPLFTFEKNNKQFVMGIGRQTDVSSGAFSKKAIQVNR